TPVEVTIGSRNEGTKNVSHEYYVVNARDRYDALKRLADAHPDIFSVVFCRTKIDTQKVAERLIEDGYNAAALHGDLSQNQRDLVMKSFRNHQVQMLVATDVAARGIDVDDITHVINYQLPDEIETYTHRSGRTGRAGKTGVCIVIVSKSEARKIEAIEKIIQQEFRKKEIPSGMEICEVQLFHLANTIKDTKINPEINAYLPAISEVLEEFSKEELIKKMFSVEFTRFFNYYKNAKDLNVSEGKGTDSGDSDSIRYFLNIGAKDGFDWMSLKDFLKEILELGRDDVFKVDVKDSFSFFNTDEKHRDKVMEVFKNFKMGGRDINVEESLEGNNTGRKRNRGSSRRSDRDDRGSLGDRGGRSDRSERRSEEGSSRRRGNFPAPEKRSRRREKPQVPGTGGKRRRR